MIASDIRRQPCPSCGGLGYRGEESCDRCGGSGIIKIEQRAGEITPNTRRITIFNPHTQGHDLFVCTGDGGFWLSAQEVSHHG